MTTLAQRNLSGGELSPKLYPRTDTAKYATAVRTMRNFFIYRSGGAGNRPGTTYICETRYSSKRSRLIPFRFSVDQTYMLEFGDLYMRVIKNGAQVTDLTLTITNITQANPAVLTYTGTDPANGDEVKITGLTGMHQLNNRNFLVQNVNTVANTFELVYLYGADVNSTSFEAYVSGGTASRIYQISTPYAEADLQELKYDQSADVITITNTAYLQKELRRSSDTSWTLTSITFAPSISAPTGLAGPGGTFTKYKVTAVKDETFEESVASASVSAGVVEPSPTASITLTWNAVSGAREYNVYRSKNGSVYGLVDIADSNTYTDIGVPPDTTQTPPDTRDPFSGAGNYPACAAYIQQRRMFAASDNNPETVWGSRIGKYNNFTISTPIEDTDAVTISLAGRQINRIKHIIDLGRPVLLTESGEWVVQGGSFGVITPTQRNLKQIGYNGSSSLPPIIADAFAIFVQNRGSIVRDIAFDANSPDGYVGKDLTIFSSHLFDQYTLTDWSFQKIPNYIAWVVRDDGKVNGLTYVREHDIWGWHRHDFQDAIVENVSSIAEGNEDVVYFIINRTIDGRTVRYIERLNTREIDETAVEDAIFMDSAYSYDGTNTSDVQVKISGGTTWAADELLTMTSNMAYFVSTDVGTAIHVTDDSGNIIRFLITAYSSSTSVSGFPHKTVPVSLQNQWRMSWSKAISTLQNLWHLEGKAVSVFADGRVVSSPNNPLIDSVTVTNGAIAIDRPYAKIHVGLPIIADLESLDLDLPQGGSIVDKQKLITHVTAIVERTRGFWVGPKPPDDDDTDPVQYLSENKSRNSEDYESPPSLKTEPVTIQIKGEWNSNGRVFFRVIDPVPVSFLSIYPAGYIPIPGGG